MRSETLLLELAYQGSAFHGVAPQAGFVTVSSELTRRLSSAFGSAPRALAFSSRTDAGVDARQNYASCRVPQVNVERGLAALVAANDAALRVLSTQRVERSFHARNFARSKHYRYRLPVSDFGRPEALDLETMQNAARLFVGEHDFSAFRAAGCGAKTTIRCIDRLTLHQLDEGIVIDVVGASFLRKMVRILVGALVEVGMGRQNASWISELLEAANRRANARTAPARGLTLMSVELENPN